MHRLLSIGMTQHNPERLDIGRKSRFTPLARSAVHSGPPIRMKIAPITTSCGCQREKIHDLEFCDSVRLHKRKGMLGTAFRPSAEISFYSVKGYPTIATRQTITKAGNTPISNRPRQPMWS
jgi:hypothetical protein